jgi:glycerol-3-phosphate acyltransferase PlsY
MLSWDLLKFIGFTFIAYLIGSIPFAQIASWLFKKGDIRKKGTGNVGGGNVIQVIGPLVGIAVILLDAFKGLGAAYLAKAVFGSTFAVMVLGIAAIFGHCFSIFLGFKGGKGVATTIGMYAFINFKLIFVIYFVWLLLNFIIKYSAISTMLVAASYPFILLFLKADHYYVLFTFFIAMMLLLNHRQQLTKILRGEEKTFKQEISEAKRSKGLKEVED